MRLRIVSFLLLLLPLSARAQCVGDCNGDAAVTVDEVVRGVGIALGNDVAASCEAIDRDGNGQVFVDEIIVAVNNALCGCNRPCDSPTPTVTPSIDEEDAAELSAGLMIVAVGPVAELVRTLDSEGVGGGAGVAGIMCPGGGSINITSCRPSINTFEIDFTAQVAGCGLPHLGFDVVADGDVSFSTASFQVPCNPSTLPDAFSVRINAINLSMTYGAGTTAELVADGTLAFSADGSVAFRSDFVRVVDPCLGTLVANTRQTNIILPASATCPQSGSYEVRGDTSTAVVTFMTGGIGIDSDADGSIDVTRASCGELGVMGCGP